MQPSTSAHHLKQAEKGVWISIGAYIVLAVANIAVAELVHSDALRANGYDNVTDILSNIALLIGLRVARVPADSDHVYGHWKVESITSLVASLIMTFVGFEVLWTTVNALITPKSEPINPLGAIAGGISAMIIFGVYLYTRKLGRQVKSEALLTASRDNLADSFTSFGTAIAVVAASFHFSVIDQIMALIISGFIFKTAYDIFRDSVFSLTDGFDEEKLEEYRMTLEKVDKVLSVKLLRGRTYGENVFLDVVIEMSPDMTVSESHATTEIIEKLLEDKFGVYDTDVHVEPATLPDDERDTTLALKLLALEEQLLNQELLPSSQGASVSLPVSSVSETLSALTADNFVDIGRPKTSSQHQHLALAHYAPYRLSKRSFILNYDYTVNGTVYTVLSVWRRKDIWRCVERQTTVLKN